MTVKSGTIDKDTAKLHLKAIGEVEAEKAERKVDEIKEVLQLKFEFSAVYSDLALRETIANVKAITKAAIRMGVLESIIKSALQSMAIGKPIIIDAINAIDESLAD